jgi:hypothetical protein
MLSGEKAWRITLKRFLVGLIATSAGNCQPRRHTPRHARRAPAQTRCHASHPKAKAELLLELGVFAADDPHKAERAARLLPGLGQLCQAGVAAAGLVVEDVGQKRHDADGTAALRVALGVE